MANKGMSPLTVGQMQSADAVQQNVGQYKFGDDDAKRQQNERVMAEAQA